MKTVNHNASGRNRSLGLLLGAALLCLGSSAQAQNDPSGTWDFVISGSQQGVAFLSFNKDSTITGYEVITSYTPPQGDDGRTTALGSDRTGISVSSGTNTTQSRFGYTPVTGNWNFDTKGHTIGFLNEGEQEGGDLAGGLSFVATVRPGERMTMKVVDSPNPALLDFKPRTRHYRGIALQPNDDLSGSFYANGVKNTTVSGGTILTTTSVAQKYVEFFSLTNFDAIVAGDPSFLTTFPFFTNIVGSDASANAYFLSGSGPGYTNFGLALFSAQKKLAIVSVQTGNTSSNSVLRSLSGSFNVGSSINGAGRLFGVDDDSDRISYKVWRF